MGIPVYFVGLSKDRCNHLKETCDRSGGLLTFCGSWDILLHNADQLLPTIQNLNSGWLVIEVRAVTPEGCVSLMPEDDSLRKGQASNDSRLYSLLEKIRKGLNSDTRILAISSLNYDTPSFHLNCLKAGASHFLYDYDLWSKEFVQSFLFNPPPRTKLEIKRLTLRPSLRQIEFGDGIGSEVYRVRDIEFRQFILLYYITLAKLVGSDHWLLPHEEYKFKLAYFEIYRKISSALAEPDLRILSELTTGIKTVLQNLPLNTHILEGHNVRGQVHELNRRVQMAAYRCDCKGLITLQHQATQGRRRGYELDVPAEGINFEFPCH